MKRTKKARSDTPSVTLPAPNPAMRHFTEYLAAGFNRSSYALRNSFFTDVIAAIDSTYELIRNAEHTLPGFARIFVVCHQALYSSASSICRGVPHDAAASSRRALEAARVALAVRKNPKNLEEWVSFAERMGRWQARQEGIKPPAWNLKFDGLAGDRMSQQISTITGVLSDYKVHFTPEFLSEVDFQVSSEDQVLYSDYLTDDEQAQAQGFKMLAAVHFLILRVLARVALQELAISHQFEASLRRIVTAARALYVRYPFEERPEFESVLKQE
ncbi:MAG: hypothetical protein JNK87_19620 [Bryobacterales bacterium]|nr:hypothetical protein [Bryobacterales bacterium]